MPAKKKKSGGGAAAGAAGADDDVALDAAVDTAASEAAATPEVVEEPAAEGEDAEDAAEEGQGTAAGGKKKKKKKKKTAAAGEEDADEEAAPAAALVAAAAPAAAVVAANGEDDEEDDDGEDGGEGGAKKKKSKKRGKKKNKPDEREDDEAFQKWVVESLEATRNGTETMSAEDLKKNPQPFFGYRYSGDLRPWFVTPRLKMPSGIHTPDYAFDPDGRSESERAGMKEVPVLEGSALVTMREVCRMGREVLDIASRFMKAGVTGDQIDRIVYQACVDRKIYPSPLNYNRFPKSVCVSPNEVICHGIPDCRPIEEGDIVNLDVSVFYNGYHSDLNETFFIGECDEDSQRLVRTAYNSLREASKMIRPGTFYRDVGNNISAEAAKSNCAVVNTYCGHGVGELFHGPPRIPHYRKNKAVGIMKAGHVFTIEPMLNLGSNGGDKTWPDDWTAVTPNGSRSAQFEQTFLVTQDGFEVLTARPGTDRFSMPEWDPSMFQC